MDIDDWSGLDLAEAETSLPSTRGGVSTTDDDEHRSSIERRRLHTRREELVVGELDGDLSVVSVMRARGGDITATHRYELRRGRFPLGTFTTLRDMFSYLQKARL